MFRHNYFFNLAVLAFCFTIVSTAKSQTIIYSDDFNGNGSALLDGSPEDQQGTLWSANSFITNNGSINGVDEGSAVLPFEPQVNSVYTLTMDVFNVSEQWIALGFCRDAIQTPAANNFDDRFSNGAEGIAWMLYRDSANLDEDVQIFEGFRAAGLVYSEDPFSDFFVSRQLEIVIDTTGDGSSFMADFSIDGTLLYSGEIPINIADINFVGMSFNATSMVSVTVENFQLVANSIGKQPTFDPPYFEGFDGTGQLLNGTSEDLQDVEWAANSFINDDGTINGSDEGSALLPFTAQLDTVYTLSMDVLNQTDRWVALGFARNSIGFPGASELNDRFSNLAEGVSWMLYRDSANPFEDVQIFEGFAAGGNIYSDDPISDFSVVRNLQIEIDTTGDGTNFSAEFSIDGSTILAAVIPIPVDELNFVGFSFDNETTDPIIVDNFSFTTSSDVLLGDVNCDGAVDLLDVAPFVDLVTTGGFSPKADVNEDGAVNLLDVAPFVELLTAG